MFKKILFVLGGAMVLVIAYYFISPLFISVSLDEASPVSISEVVPTDVPAPASASLAEENKVENTKDTSVEDAPKNPAPKKETVATIVGTPGHPASGSVRILKTDSGDVVRMEDFETINGPDLFVYLTTDLEATEFVDLGELKATEGNINYAVPEGVDVTQYAYVVVWCKQFGVLFNYAEIASL